MLSSFKCDSVGGNQKRFEHYLIWWTSCTTLWGKKHRMHMLSPCYCTIEEWGVCVHTNGYRAAVILSSTPRPGITYPRTWPTPRRNARPLQDSYRLRIALQMRYNITLNHIVTLYVPYNGYRAAVIFASTHRPGITKLRTWPIPHQNAISLQDIYQFQIALQGCGGLCDIILNYTVALYESYKGYQGAAVLASTH